MRVFVILPAAGIGTRMSSGTSPATPKQFLSIGGVPVLVHCLRAFLAVARERILGGLRIDPFGAIERERR